jgi:outer membrane protein assembly factor BamB
LWYGDPGPGEMVNRHEGAVGPLAVNGRLIVQGQFSVMAYDAYNGMFLWEYENAETYRTGVFQNHNSGNLIASDDSVFVMEGSKVVELDIGTGKLKATHLLPVEKRKEYEWGFIAYQDGQLIGTATVRKQLVALLKKRGKGVEDMTDGIFAIDVKTGKHLWSFEGKNIEAPTIAIAPGKVYFIDSAITMEQREAIMLKEKDKLKDLKGAEAKAAEARLKKLDVRLAVAIDAKTGKQLWARPVDVTNCSKIGIGGGNLTLMVSQDVLVLGGANANGHYWKQFVEGDFKIRRLVALSAKDGELLWAKDANYRIRPLIVGSKVIAEPWAFDLFTGKQIMRKNPLTGQEEPWSIIRSGHHCGMLVGCPNLLLFRSGSTGYYDLYHDSGTQHFAGHRIGCWINALPANGLVLIPESSAGCVCQFSLEATITLGPRKTKHSWTIFSSTGQTTPVEHLSLNLGAPGDRKDGHGQLWLAYPRPKPERVTALDLKLSLAETFTKGGSFESVSSQFVDVASLNAPDWLFTSWAQGLKQLKIPVRGEKDGPASYTVRLYFAEVAKDAKPGQRVFDVKIQGKTVLKNFDPVAARKDEQTAILHEVEGIQVETDLLIELIPTQESTDPARMPILNALEVIREKK